MRMWSNAIGVYQMDTNNGLLYQERNEGNWSKTNRALIIRHGFIENHGCKLEGR